MRGARGRADRERQPWPPEVHLYLAVASLAALAVLVVLAVGGVRSG
jgi:hypothetical protein